ncbi:MAG TPA: 2-phospho-L-lactate transferase, partial [Candidatus Binatia bacterium]|nr:2-phospho-L-lactate transferase [Candidatus Binatia bacterium]
ALTGGTGGAKLVEGLAAVIDPSELTIVCNTGDDCVFHGLHISPDIDTIAYTLAGLSDTEKGWGVKGDTFVVLEQLRRLGNDAWFNLGDKDLATHITRTRLLNEGRKLSEVTEQLRRRIGIPAQILPMSDERVETRVETPEGEISFQEFFVKEHWAPDVLGVRFVGAEQSHPAPGVLDAIERADAIIVCPSNPITSIGPILAVPGIRAALQDSRTRVVGVSPIIGSTAISGPAHKLMAAAGWEVSPLGVARGYGDFLDALLIAEADAGLSVQIRELQINPVCVDIRMPTAGDKQRLARQVLASVQK